MGLDGRHSGDAIGDLFWGNVDELRDVVARFGDGSENECPPAGEALVEERLRDKVVIAMRPKRVETEPGVFISS